MNKYAEEWEEAGKSPLAHQYIACSWYQNEQFYKMSGIMSTGDFLYKLTELDIFNEDIGKNTLLELGCGTGRQTQFFAEVFDKVIAVDCSESMVKKGKERVPHSNIDWKVGNGENLEGIVEDESIDIAYTFIVLQHMKDEQVKNYMKDIYRVLKPGGYILFQLPKYDKHKEPQAFGDVGNWTQADIRVLMAKFEEIKLGEGHFDLHIFKKV
jgi:ubiquinone/menaquinone biosynthesis C-methylase UbiE